MKFFRYEYELVVYPGVNLNDTVNPVVRVTAKAPPIFINPQDLGGSTAAGQIFTVGIRLKSVKVSHHFISSMFFGKMLTKFLQYFIFQTNFYSHFHEIEHIEVQPTWITTVLPNKTSMWLVLIPILLIVGAAGGVFYMVRRNRRLSNSFSRFANSHYDTKTGTTRIGDEEDHHHNDTDNINDLPRFDDDEPLVIT